MPYENWKDKKYTEVEGSINKMHPDVACKDKKPFYLDIIENSKYYACNSCNSAWVDRVRQKKENKTGIHELH